MRHDRPKSPRVEARQGAHPTPSALSLRDAAAILTRAGGREIAEESIRADVQAGAPLNADGTINIVHYGAWLIKAAAEEAGAH